MEEKPSLYRLIRVRSFLLKHPNRKFISLDMLAKGVGFYSDVLAQDLLPFAPMVLMDPSVNMQDLLPEIDAYIQKEKEERASSLRPKRQVAKKGELASYRDYADFIYQKMAGPGGLLSPGASLNDHDLHVLGLLVKKEATKRQKAERLALKKEREKKK